MNKKFHKYGLLVIIPVILIEMSWTFHEIPSYCNNPSSENSSDFFLDKDKLSTLESKNIKFDSLRKDTQRFESDFHIFIDQNALKQLNSNLPFSGFKYTNAQMVFPNGEKHEVKIRYRGDGKFHWLYDRKSFRIKTTKDNLYEKNRWFNLIVPKSNELMNNHLTYKLAKLLDLLSPDSKMVTLDLNDHYDGTRLYVEQLNESFLRKNRLMPCDLYKADNVGFAHYLGLPHDQIFNGAYYWEKIASNNHYDKKDKTNLIKLLDDLAENDISMLNIKDFAKLSVLITLTQSKHLDNIHNWRLYYDNYSERFSPVVWDLVGWYKDFMPGENVKPNIDIICSVIFEKLFKDYRFLYYRHLTFMDFFKNEEEAFFIMLDDEINSVKNKLSPNDYSLDLSMIRMNREETIEHIEKFRKNVEKLFSDIEQITLLRSSQFVKHDARDFRLTDNVISKEFKKAIQFNNKGSNIVLNTNGIPNATFTYEFWFNTNETHEIDKENHNSGVAGASDQHFAILPGHGGKDQYRGTGVSVGTNGISLYEHKGHYLGARIVFEDSLKGWNHVAVVYDNNAPALYVNGLKAAAKKATKDIIKPLFDLGGQSHNNKYYKGLLDEFRIWNRALTQAEIQANMYIELTGEEEGLELYYNFNKIKNGKILQDASGNSRYGIIANAPPAKTQSIYQYSVYNNKIRILLDGRIPIEKIFLTFNKKVNKVNKIHIEYMVNNVQIRKDISGDVTFLKKAIIINKPLFSNMEVIQGALNLFPASYDLMIDGVEMNALKNVNFQIMDLDNTLIEPEKMKFIETQNFNNVYNVVQENPIKQRTVWQDTIIVKGLQIIDNDLIIKAGTKIFLDEKATVKVLGSVSALGTSDAPIRFIPLKKNKLWGAFVLKDEKANGSILKFCHFIGGSGLKGDVFEYIGMLSIHNVKDVRIFNCTFKDNEQADDMVHIVYSDVTFEKCTFQNAYGDALDSDISNIEIKNCTFSHSGDDALDLMTSNAVVLNNEFINSKDKGIAIGEASQLLAINNKFALNNIAVEAKEESKGIIYNSFFTQNKKALNAYKKNWRYTLGGNIELYKSVLTGNYENVTIDSISRTMVFDCYVDGNVSAVKEIKFTNCDSTSRSIPVSTGITRIDELNDFFLKFIGYKRDDVRGLFE